MVEDGEGLVVALYKALYLERFKNPRTVENDCS